MAKIAVSVVGKPSVIPKDPSLLSPLIQPGEFENSSALSRSQLLASINHREGRYICND